MATLIWPGGTQTQEFTIPFPAADIAKVLVTYRQDEVNVLEKEITVFEDAEEDGKAKFSFVLTQEESLRFAPGDKLIIQLNVIKANGDRIPSKPLFTPCGIQYHREVIT